MLVFIREVRMHDKFSSFNQANKNTTQRRGMLSLVERFMKRSTFRHTVVRGSN